MAAHHDVACQRGPIHEVDRLCAMQASLPIASLPTPMAVAPLVSAFVVHNPQC